MDGAIATAALTSRPRQSSAASGPLRPEDVRLLYIRHRESGATADELVASLFPQQLPVELAAKALRAAELPRIANDGAETTVR